MSVTKIDDYRSRDTIAALEDLLERARGGHLRGVAFTIKTGARQHRLGITGEYWDDPLQVLSCVTRMAYKVNQLLSARSGEPETRTMPL